jgi:hypothetical protein
MLIPVRPGEQPNNRLVVVGGRVAAAALNVLVGSLGIVRTPIPSSLLIQLMAGSGSLDVLRFLRFLRRRRLAPPEAASKDVNTQSAQVALNMALGMLFLGRARYLALFLLAFRVQIHIGHE